MNKLIQTTQLVPNLRDDLVQAAYPVFIPKPIRQSDTLTRYLNVRQFSERHPVFTEAALRNLIFKADSRKSSIGLIRGNGLIEFGAIIRLGKKVLIKEQKFFDWLDEQSKGKIS